MARKNDVAQEFVPLFCGSEEVPVEFRKVYLELVSLTDEFCNELLDVEYQEMCRELAIDVCQTGSPVMRGKPASWASGIVYTVGWANFLGDPSFEPHVRSADIAKWFGVSVGTMLGKSKIIREGLDFMPLDPAYTLPSQLAENPLIWFLNVNGFIMDIRTAPREAQQVAYENSLIPFIPADREQPESPYAVVHQRVQSPGRNPPKKTRKVNVAYQLKVSLDGSKPPIWRRLRVPDCRLDELHEIIQVAVGWTNSHMHEFHVGDQRFSTPEMEEFGEVDPQARQESEVLLSELVKSGHKKLRYFYDFGDDWRHTITIEKTLDPMPKDCLPECLAGARACPPEDIGGLWGYADFLAAKADPKHELHEEFEEWYEGKFDPELFDLEAVNQLLMN